VKSDILAHIDCVRLPNVTTEHQFSNVRDVLTVYAAAMTESCPCLDSNSPADLWCLLLRVAILGRTKVLADYALMAMMRSLPLIGSSLYTSGTQLPVNSHN